MDAEEAVDRQEAYDDIRKILNTPAETLITSQDKPDMASVAPRLRGPLHDMFREEVEHFQVRVRPLVEENKYYEALKGLEQLHKVLQDYNNREQTGGTCLELDSMNQHLSVLQANLMFLNEKLGT